MPQSSLFNACNEKFNQQLFDKAIDYLDNYQTYGDVIPSLYGLADHLKITRQTLDNARNSYEQFNDFCELLIARKIRVLKNRGLLGDFSPALTKLLLSQHGYIDKVENTNNNQSTIKVEKKWNLNFVGTDDWNRH